MHTLTVDLPLLLLAILQEEGSSLHATKALTDVWNAARCQKVVQRLFDSLLYRMPLTAAVSRPADAVVVIDCVSYSSQPLS